MNYRGKIIRWNRNRGFGFVQANDGEDQVFAHISAFSNRRRQPRVGDSLDYQLTQDDDGRSRAVNISYVGEKSEKPNQRHSPKQGSSGKGRMIISAVILLVVIAVVLYTAFGGSP